MGCFRLWSQDAVGGDRWVCCVWQLCALAWLAEAVLEFGWAGESSSSPACRAAHLVLTCCCGSCVLLCCSSAARLLPCCSCAPHALQRGCGSSGWELGNRVRARRVQGVQSPAPAALARAGTLTLLNHRPCTQPAERARLTCPRGNEGAHGASPICLSQFPPVAGGQDVCCHTIV